jgi:RNA polymerase sigma factor (sigma-70 family)
LLRPNDSNKKAESALYKDIKHKILRAVISKENNPQSELTKAASEQLWEEFKNFSYSLARQLLKRHSLADDGIDSEFKDLIKDLVQEAAQKMLTDVVRKFELRKSLNEGTTFKSYFAQVIQNHLLDVFLRQKNVLPINRYTYDVGDAAGNLARKIYERTGQWPSPESLAAEFSETQQKELDPAGPSKESLLNALKIIARRQTSLNEVKNTLNTSVQNQDVGDQLDQAAAMERLRKAIEESNLRKNERAVIQMTMAGIPDNEILVELNKITDKQYKANTIRTLRRTAIKEIQRYLGIKDVPVEREKQTSKMHKTNRYIK